MCADPLHFILGLVLLVAYVIFEYWVGKTRRTSAASGLELLLLAALAVFAYLMRRKNGREGN